jgi:hypothetical protein
MTFARALAALSLAAWTLPTFATLAPAATAMDAAARLRATHAQIYDLLQRNDFGRPVHLDSREDGRNLKGDVHAVMDHPFATVEGALQKASSWCQVLILPFNTKHCTSEGDKTLSLYVGKKKDTPLADAYRLDFNYQVTAVSRDYLQVVLSADSGPLGTSNYRILLEATPLDDSHTFLHLSYAYTYGAVSNFAMQTYLATVGASKVGFTIDGRDDEGKPRYVKGMRGVMERNTMRYFLAIDAYLDSLSAAPGTRTAKRIDDWFSASERYARQLHEMSRGDYVAMKQREIERLQRAAAVAGS